MHILLKKTIIILGCIATVLGLMICMVTKIPDSTLFQPLYMNRDYIKLYVLRTLFMTVRHLSIPDSFATTRV